LSKHSGLSNSTYTDLSSCRHPVTAPILGLQYYRRSIPSAAGLGASESISIFSGVSSVSTRDAEGPGDSGSGIFIAEEVGVGDKWSGDTTTVDVQILLGDFQTWDYFPHLLKYQDFWSISICTKGILLHQNTS
jgi:hypothetical protein